MESTSSEKKEVRMCCDCGVRPVKPQKNAKRPFWRCEECQRTHKREEMRRLRAKWRANVEDIPEKKMKRCTKCQRLKPYTAFSVKKSSNSGELNKICDACLYKIYQSQDKSVESFTDTFWRAKAYSVNCAHKALIASRQCVPASSLTFDVLEYKCTPLDLVDLHRKQKGICPFCGITLTKKNLSIDHVIPKQRGGSLLLDNLHLCCKDCNTLKWTKTADEFEKFLVEYATRIINRTKG